MRVKKLLTLTSLLVTAALCLTGCGPIGSLFMDLSYTSREDAVYCDTVEAFFEALERGDAEGVRTLFAPQVRDNDPDLDQKIQALIGLYSGPTDTNTCADSNLGGHYSTEDGHRTAQVYSTFPVISDGGYYWWTFRLCYVNDADEDRVGLTQVVFYTAEDYCLCRYDESWQAPEEEGLILCAEGTLDGEVRAVDGYPYRFAPTNTPLDPADVKEFLKTSDSYEAFTARFGQPQAVHIYTIYELLPEDGQPRYLQLGTDGKTIHSAAVVDDLDWLYEIG